MRKEVTYYETQRLLREPWITGELAMPVYYEGEHPVGERVEWRLYHNDPSYISIRLFAFDGRPLVEFTETPDRVKGAVEAVANYEDEE